jgi:hypothetical protein
MTESSLSPAAAADGSYNRSTQTYVRVLGAALGLAATAPGVFELHQGDRETGGHLLTDMGAFTLLASYRATGLGAMSVGVALCGWSLSRMRSRSGAPVFLLLSALAFLLGGGVAQVPVSLLVWAAATRIDSSLSWWERSLPPKAREAMAAAWLPVFIVGLGLVVAGIALWLLVLPPGDRRKVGGAHYALWSVLACGLALLVAAVPCGFARDIETNAIPPTLCRRAVRASAPVRATRAAAPR